jgi:hypothetical protein
VPHRGAGPRPPAGNPDRRVGGRGDPHKRLGEVWEFEGFSVPQVRSKVTSCFEFPVTPHEQPKVRATARFTDYVGLHWQIDPDLHLEKLDAATGEELRLAGCSLIRGFTNEPQPGMVSTRPGRARSPARALPAVASPRRWAQAPTLEQ